MRPGMPHSQRCVSVVAEIGIVYEPALIAADGENMFYKPGAFRREQDAQAVLDLCRAEGRRPVPF